MTKFKKIASGVAVAALIGLPLLGLAQETITGGVESVNDIYNLVVRIANWLQAFFFIIAAVFIILAAFGYLTAGGDDEKVKAAKQKLIYAIVAIVVAILAFAVKNVVAQFIGGTSTAL